MAGSEHIWRDFAAGQGERIDPLTVSDAHSRYLLRCQSVEKTDTEHVLAIFAAAFREYGLPQTIRTDNGAPFASRAIAGISRLSIYWMKLGIQPERIRPGHPEQNGRHERMHRTLKAETAKPPAAGRRAQQKVLTDFASSTTRNGRNVLIALWDVDPQLNKAAQSALDSSLARGALVITGAVYAGLLASRP